MLDEVIYKKNIYFLFVLLCMVQLAWKVTGCRIFFLQYESHITCNITLNYITSQHAAK